MSWESFMAKVTVSMFVNTGGNLVASVAMAVDSSWIVGVKLVWM